MEKLIIQNVIAINPATSQGYVGDVYENETGTRCFFNSFVGLQVIDQEITESFNDGYWYLRYDDGIPVMQGIKPYESHFYYVPESLDLYDVEATLYSPVTGKTYSGKVFSYINKYGNQVLFFWSKATGRPIQIDEQETDAHKEQKEYWIKTINDLPVIQTLYESWGDITSPDWV